MHGIFNSQKKWPGVVALSCSVAPSYQFILFKNVFLHATEEQQKELFNAGNRVRDAEVKT
jgi:hypothetical protein